LANISYIGDIRTYLKAEKEDKVKNVILGALNYYEEIYDKIALKYSINYDNEYYYINHDKSSLEFYFKNIPIEFKRRLINNEDENDFKNKLCKCYSHIERKKLIDSHLKRLNLKYSIYGIVSGIYSSDFFKGVNLLIFNYLFI
jgi:hypothetical protein